MLDFLCLIGIIVWLLCRRVLCRKPEHLLAQHKMDDRQRSRIRGMRHQSTRVIFRPVQVQDPTRYQTFPGSTPEESEMDDLLDECADLEDEP